MTCRFKTVGLRLGQHTYTCSIHHFKGKMLNINIFAISSNIFHFFSRFCAKCCRGKFQKQIDNIHFCFLATISASYGSLGSYENSCKI